jgi:hypothetical protein
VFVACFSATAMYQLIDAVEKPLRTMCVASPRKLLFVTCLLMFLSSLFMSGFSAWLCIFFYDIEYSYEWASFLGLAIVGGLLGMVCVLGLRGAHIVTLDLLLMYFWFTIVLVAPLAMGTVISFDSILYMQIWFDHSWTLDSFSKLRNLFCPEDTADFQCAAPIQGGRFFNSTLLWCLDRFQETTCQEIRDAAVVDALNWGSLAMLVEGIVCLSNIGLILFSLYLSYRILTSSVITQSMNDIMNFLLVLPTLACGLVARNMWWMRKYDIPFYFLADFYLIFCGVQIAMLPLGVLAGRMKSQRIMGVYIFFATLVSCGLGGLGGVSMFVAGLIILPENYTINR